jgi:hypothetical protein
VPEGVETLAYADDLAIMVKAKDETELVRRENEAVERVARWMEINHLAPAPGKTEAALRIGRKKCRPLVGLGLRGFALETKKEVKYLGVVRDQGLTFAPPHPLCARESQEGGGSAFSHYAEDPRGTRGQKTATSNSSNIDSSVCCAGVGECAAEEEECQKASIGAEGNGHQDIQPGTGGVLASHCRRKMTAFRG